MSIEFKKVVNKSSYLDPRKKFEPQTVETEIRWDPLTGKISRIFPFRNLVLHRHDWTPFVEESKKRFCPFCPDVLETVTPKFTPDFAPEGRIKVGDAVAIPNLNPYEKYASVVVMSSRHYIPMEEIDVKLMVDSMQASLIYLQKALSYDPAGAAYSSINWNYMPYSGGSLVHPHLQVLAGAEPCTFDKQLLDSSANYYQTEHGNYWSDLITAEKNNGDRYLGQTGGVHWVSAFAPRHVGEVIGILPGKQTINELTETDLAGFAAGLKNIINYYHSINIVSFNAAIYFAGAEDTGYSIHARIIGRFTIFPLVGSDITHMQVLHDDPWTVALPESIAEGLKKYF